MEKKSQNGCLAFSKTRSNKIKDDNDLLKGSFPLTVTLKYISGWYKCYQPSQKTHDHTSQEKLVLIGKNILYTKKYEKKFLPFIKDRNEVIIALQQCKLCLMTPKLYI